MWWSQEVLTEMYWKLCNCHESSIIEQHWVNLNTNTLNCRYSYWGVSILQQLTALWYQQKWLLRLHFYLHHTIAQLEVMCSDNMLTRWKSY